jgi:ferredoxin
VRYETRGIPLIQQGEEADALYIVSDGAVQIAVDRPDGSHRILEYLRAGEFFGEMALLGGGARSANVLTAGRCELVKLNGTTFMELCQRYPEVEKHVRGVIERRQRQEKLITPEISDLLEKGGQLGYVQAAALLVMDLDLCVKCDNCVKACESLHGESRLVRSGVTIGKYLVPVVCRHCEDPRCMNSCPTGAVERRPEGEIYFQYDMCIGCGKLRDRLPLRQHRDDRDRQIRSRAGKKGRGGWPALLSALPGCFSLRCAGSLGADFFRPCQGSTGAPRGWGVCANTRSQRYGQSRDASSGRGWASCCGCLSDQVRPV